MAKIKEEIKNEILAAAQILDIIKDYNATTKQGTSHFCKCPECGKEGKGKGLSINPNKNVAKCFSCSTAQSPVNYLMKYQGKTYPEALLYIAEKYNITVEEVKPKRRSKSKSELKKPFLNKVLKESGLDKADIRAEVDQQEDKLKQVDLFQAGTIDDYNNIVTGDDIIIHYYDLHGKRIMYQSKTGTKMRPLWRVRWQNPEAHPLKDGSFGKYKSPYGSGSHLFIPHQVRRAYNNGGVINTLYIDEGEKKAIKSCKHGMFSVGIMGIHNFVQNNKLPHEIQLLVQKCSVKNVVFRVDADVFELSRNLKYGSHANNRPYTFYKAIIKFRDYVKTLYSIGLHVEIFFGYIKPTELKEKGIDDVLAGSMKGKELDFLRDSTNAIESNGDGEFTQFYNVTTISTMKLKELWGLQSPEAFANKYLKELREIPEFKLFGIKYRINEKDELEFAQPLMPEETFYNEEWRKDKVTYTFKYTRAMTFLQNRGYFRYMPAAGKFNWIHIENKIVRNVEPWEIRDFVMNTAKGLNNEEVQDMLIKGGPQYLGPEKLSNLEFAMPEFERAGKDFQMLYFKDSYWKITADTITEEKILNVENHVWNDKVNKFTADINPKPLVKITAVDDFLKNLSGKDKKDYQKFSGNYIIKLTAEGEKSQFLRFLKNTSTFSWNKAAGEISLEDKMEDYQHLLSKMWAFGYLLHTFFVRSKARAVIGMDGTLSALGESQGGTGKSILGFALGHIIPQFYLDATKKDITEDKFLWDGMTEKHDSCFIDDVRTNFDFKILFNSIEGRWDVQNKGERRFRIPEAETQRIYLTTNNAINGEGNSYTRRQFVIAFSDYYHADRTPADEFGGDMFNDWSKDQWDLFYNAAASCLQVYFKYPVLYAPNKRLQQRRLRQFIGEDFIFWADEYYGFDEDGHGDNINECISRKKVNEDFFMAMPREKRFTNATRFKKKLKAYCRYKNFKFNPVQAAGDDKRGSVEYFTVANDQFAL